MELTIQTASLHWQNNSKQWMDWSCNKAMTMTAEQAIEKHQETSRRELVDKSSTVLCAPMSIHNVPGSGTLSQLLVTWKKAKSGLETWIVSAKGVKTNLEWIWATSYSWRTALNRFPVDFSKNPTGDLLKSPWMMMWSLRVMWPSIGDDMGCHWWINCCK